MATKHHISSARVYDLWNNCARIQQMQDIPNLKKISPHAEVNFKEDFVKDDSSYSSKKKKSKSNPPKIIETVDTRSEMTQNKLEQLRNAALHNYGV